MDNCKGTLISIIMIISLLPSISDGSTNSPILVNVEIINNIDNNRKPIFKVEIKNVTRRKIKIIDVRKRSDLSSNFCRLFILHNGEQVSYPVIINDLGTITSKEYIVIDAGESIILTNKELVNMKVGLHPGNYSAFVEYWPDPINNIKESYVSKKVRFIVQ